jgi:hypothetical protein
VQKDFSDTRRKYFKRSKLLLSHCFFSLSENQKQQVNARLYASEKLADAYTLKEVFYPFTSSSEYETAKHLLKKCLQMAFPVTCLVLALLPKQYFLGLLII